MNDGGDDGRTVPAIAPVDILHHLLAPRMLEIDIDVGRLQPLLGNEAFEQQIDLGRIDGSDAEHVAHGGIGRRPSPLTQDVLTTCIMHDVVHGEKIMRVFEFGDEIELLTQSGAQRVINLAAETGLHTRPGQVFQMLLRGLARRHRLVGILIFELIERKRDAGGKPHGLRDRLRRVAKQPRHFICGLEMAFGIGLNALADRLDGRLLADAGEDILQGAARRMMVKHLIGRQQRHTGVIRDTLEPGQAPPVVAAV